MPDYRNLTPEEWAVLQAQGSQGMQPQIAPMSLMDLAMDAGSQFLDEADLGKYVLPATLLGMVRYKRPGVSKAARETAESYHYRPPADPLKAKEPPVFNSLVEASNYFRQNPQGPRDVLVGWSGFDGKGSYSTHRWDGERLRNMGPARPPAKNR